MTDSTVLTGAQISGRGRSLNSFVIVPDASGFIGFVEQVFDGSEVAAARTPTPDGLLIHAEVQIGDSLLLVCDPQPGWPIRAGLFQLWVADLDTVVPRAIDRGARLITPPTPFYGSITLARIEDPWGSLWWLYQQVPGQPDPLPVWEGGSDVVFRTLDEHLKSGMHLSAPDTAPEVHST